LRTGEITGYCSSKKTPDQFLREYEVTGSRIHRLKPEEGASKQNVERVAVKATRAEPGWLVSTGTAR
jgi:hypothetical protein